MRMRQESGPKNLVEMLVERAVSSHKERGFVFLEDGELDERRMSYVELDQRARAIGVHLSETMSPGERALILYPSGLDYIAAFFGCLYAGVIAVPVYPPDPSRLHRTLPRLQAIVDDAGAKVVLTTAELKAMAAFIFEQAPDLSRLEWLATDVIDVEALASCWQAPRVEPEDLAFLQYTSGSTGQPKGVMLSHANLLHNEQLIMEAQGAGEGIVTVNWLPLYHDMGLIGAVMQPVFAGGSAVLMSPIDFLKRPVRWMQALSRYKGTAAAGPNFAYDLVVRKMKPEQLEGLDLSCWTVACNGAEPVRRDTMERFSAFFKPAGFRHEAFFPSYGLAECTLLVAAPPEVGIGPHHLTLDREALEAGKVVETKAEGGVDFCSCGSIVGDYKVAIVDGTTRQRLPENIIGEIWMQGASIARGYWGKDALNASLFQARIVGEDEAETYFRSGDLGFVHEGQLFITGRLKDLIIIRGSNHYPQDIERTVEESDPLLRPSCGAAIAVELEGQEELVVVYEFDASTATSTGADPDKVARRAARAIVEHHDISPAQIVLIASRTIEKTSSGKIQRFATRKAYLEGTLDVVHVWVRGAGADPVVWHPDPGARQPDPGARQPDPGARQPDKAHGIKAIEGWLVQRMAAELGVAEESIDLGSPFANYGMSSLEVVSLVGELESWLGREIPATALYDYPTVAALARHLVGAKDEVVEQVWRGSGRSLSEPVAIVGMGCRFPGAEGGPEAFWKLLVEGGEGIGEVPPDRWDVDAYHDPELGSTTTMNTRRAGFIEGIDRFDASFFGISRREAEAMDPQQRMLLEVTWEALEDAAMSPQSLEGSRTGVFVGLSGHDFGAMIEGPPVRAATGIAPSIAANRISYLLDLRGPSMVVDTACSSSLVALDTAVQSLRSGRIDAAIVGGVNAILMPTMSVAFSQAGMLSPDGKCKTFDAGADGYVRGEGCGVVVVKRLSDAVEAGDHILALVRGTAVNQDGRSNGLTAPNGLAQQAVIREALADAAVDARGVTLIEAHGTGTELGDAIEVQALNAVYGPREKREEAVYLGSVKTNIGHLEAGAGIAGLIKTVLVLSKKTLVPHLNLETLNPKCAFEKTPFVIPGEAAAWEPATGRRLGSVSSFGFGGTNAHVILEEAPEVTKPQAQLRERSAHLLTLSARSEEALKTLAERYVRALSGPALSNPALSNRGDETLPDLAYSANAGRSHLSERLAIVAPGTSTARGELEAFLAGEKGSALYRGSVEGGKPPQLGFLFAGQGAQRPGMGRELFETSLVFRQALERVGRLSEGLLDVPLLDVIFADEIFTDDGVDCIDALIHQTAYTQPALFALEYALYEQWRAFGVTPDAVLGHSVGEYVAAYAAGVFSLEDGLRLIIERGRLMQSLPLDGAMAIVIATKEELQPYLEGQDKVCIAVHNGPQNIAISGDKEALAKVVARLEAEGVFSRMLNVSHAFHSAKMDPILDDFEKFASTIDFSAPKLPMVSNLAGTFFAEGEVPDGRYWRRHLREAVRFEEGMKTLYRSGVGHFVELGPSSALSSTARKCVPKTAGVFASSLEGGKTDWTALFEGLGKLYVSGLGVDFEAVDRERRRKRVPLPTYPFDGRRYWPKAGDIKSY